MNVEIERIRAITNALFDCLIDHRPDGVVEIRGDLYWEVPELRLFSMDQPPTSLDVGSLKDDLMFLSRSYDQGAETMSAYQLTELASVLRAIGLAMLPAEHDGGRS